MDAVRAAILLGRRQLVASRPLEALATWRSALPDAFAAEDFAGMFVLAKNLGEASLSVAKQQSRTERAATLREAASYLQYALSLVDQCDLRGQLGAFGALYASVGRVEALLGRAERKLSKAEAARKVGVARGSERDTLVDVAAALELPCTTCEQIAGGSELVLDETDGCYYCIECYNAYYASIAEEAGVDEQADELNELSGSIESASSSNLELLAGDDLTQIIQQHEDAEEGAAETNITTGTLTEADVDGDVDTAEEVAGRSLSATEDSVTTVDKTEVALESETSLGRYSIQELLALRGSVIDDACPPGVEKLPIFKSSLRNRIHSSERAPQRGRKE